MKKAVLLPKNKQVIVLQQGNMKYDRWYKIKLKKKKSITFNSYNTARITMYDSKGKKIETTGDSDNEYERYSRNRLKKGTYYFKINYTYNSDYDIDYNYLISTLKWK